MAVISFVVSNYTLTILLLGLIIWYSLWRGEKIILGVLVLGFLIVVLGLWVWSFMGEPTGFKDRIAFIQVAAPLGGGIALLGGLFLNFWGQYINHKNQVD